MVHINPGGQTNLQGHMDTNMHPHRFMYATQMKILNGTSAHKQALVFMCLHNDSFENAVGKGKIAHHEHFLLFQQCFLTF